MSLKYPMEPGAAVNEGANLDLVARLACTMVRQEPGYLAAQFSWPDIPTDDGKLRAPTPTEQGERVAEFCFAAARHLVALAEQAGMVIPLPEGPELAEHEKNNIRRAAAGQVFAQKAAKEAMEAAEGKLAKVTSLRGNL